MTKEEAIRIISGYEVYGCGYCLQGGDEVEEALSLAVDALKQEPKWISVTELLPKFYEHVLVSRKKEEGFEPISVGYFYKNPYSDDIMFDDFLGTCGRFVLMGILAWMPMPKPYERKEE